MSLRNLLVPTDFSDQAQTSLTYALAFAKDMGATVHVLNSYYVPINPIEADYVADQGVWIEQARQRAHEEMRLLEERHLQNSGVAYQCHVHAGPAMDDINDTIRNNSIDLVVIGIYKADQWENFTGNLYTQAIRNAKAPVLLIPEQTTYILPGTVTFATDLKPLDKQEPIENLKSILTDLKAKLTLLHVHSPGEEVTSKEREELERLSNDLALLSPRVAIVEADDAEEGIVQYAQEHPSQWLMAVSHHYGLLEGLFHSSKTKKLARYTPIPLLVSHE